MREDRASRNEEARLRFRASARRIGSRNDISMRLLSNGTATAGAAMPHRITTQHNRSACAFSSGTSWLPSCDEDEKRSSSGNMRERRSCSWRSTTEPGRLRTDKRNPCDSSRLKGSACGDARDTHHARPVPYTKQSIITTSQAAPTHAARRFAEDSPSSSFLRTLSRLRSMLRETRWPRAQFAKAELEAFTHAPAAECEYTVADSTPFRSRAVLLTSIQSSRLLDKISGDATNSASSCGRSKFIGSSLPLWLPVAALGP